MNLSILNISYKYFILLYLISTTVILTANEASDTKYNIIHTNNGTTTGGPNDLGPTGDLQFIYTEPEENYIINLKWELFLNSNPNDQTTVRTNPDNIRTDALHISYIQGENLKLGGGFQILGDLGGATVQNFIHDIVGDVEIPENYPSGYKFTPTVNFQYENLFFEDNIQLFIKGEVPIIFKDGIMEFYTLVNYTSKDIYQTEINGDIGLAMDCKIYPDLPEFSGYPIKDFQTCTPELKLLIEYKNISFFWELPLMNRDVQNSVFGLGYKF